MDKKYINRLQKFKPEETELLLELILESTDYEIEKLRNNYYEFDWQRICRQLAVRGVYKTVSKCIHQYGYLRSIYFFEKDLFDKNPNHVSNYLNYWVGLCKIYNNISRTNDPYRKPKHILELNALYVPLGFHKLENLDVYNSDTRKLSQNAVVESDYTKIQENLELPCGPFEALPEISADIVNDVIQNEENINPERTPPEDVNEVIQNAENTEEPSVQDTHLLKYERDAYNY